MLCHSCNVENLDNADNCIACGRGLLALTRGTLVIGRYEVLDALGQGGMGVVYKARDHELDEVVALKALLPHLAASPEMTSRFRQEIKLARRVSHPNVCRIFEFVPDDPRAFIVMEFVDGTDFKRLLREQGPLSCEATVETVVQVCQGLDAVHREGIIHRDLKTRNVMRDTRGRVKLMDFGLATSPETSAATATGLALGTPEYMSPEQARALSVDARSDIYSLGIVTCELLTGELPVRGVNPIDTLLLQMDGPPLLDGPFAERLPAALLPVLRRALARDPAQRPATALEMAAALEQAHSGSRTPRTLALHSSRRARVSRWLAAAVVTVAAGLALWATVSGSRPPAEHATETPQLSPTPSLTGAPPSATALPSPSEPSAPRPARGMALPPSTIVAAPEPTPVATPVTASAEPMPATPTPAPQLEGRLQLAIVPWAEVTVDDVLMGTTPLRPLRLTPGTHVVRLVNPSYHALQRKVTIQAGETTRLELDLATEAFPK